MAIETRRLLFAFALLAFGCAKKPTAKAVCEKLVTAGVATACWTEPPGGLGAGALEHVVFDIPGGKTGQVLTFDKASDYTATVAAFDAAAVLAGRHRYGSESALTFVQLNSETPAELGTNAKTVVDAL